MCNLYSLTKGQQAIRDLAGAMRDTTGNLPLFPGIFPDYAPPIVRNAPDGVCEISTVRWGMPSPVFALKGRNSDPGVTNVRDVSSPHWRRWLGVESRPLAFFAGIWTRWKSVRKVKEGETENDLFAFLTTGPNAVVAPVHPKAMPVILTTGAEIERWMTVPAKDALELQRPLPDDALRIVARGKKEDGPHGD